MLRLFPHPPCVGPRAGWLADRLFPGSRTALPPLASFVLIQPVAGLGSRVGVFGESEGGAPGGAPQPQHWQRRGEGVGIEAGAEMIMNDYLPKRVISSTSNDAPHLHPLQF